MRGCPLVAAIAIAGHWGRAVTAVAGALEVCRALGGGGGIFGGLAG